MATLTYGVTVYSETLSLLTFSSIVKYLIIQYDPLIDPALLRPADSYRITSSS